MSRNFLIMYGHRMVMYPKPDEKFSEAIRVALENAKKFWLEKMQENLNVSQFLRIFESVSGSLYSLSIRKFISLNLDFLLEEDLETVKDRMYRDIGSLNDEERLVVYSIIDHINRKGVFHGN